MTDIDSPLVTFNRHDGSSAPAGIPRANQGAFAHHAVAQLLVWLAKPVKPNELVDASVVQIQRNALWLTYLMVPASQVEMTQAKGDAALWLQQLPAWMQPPTKSHVLSMNRAGSQPQVICSWPMSCANGDLASLGSHLVPGVLALDDLSEQSEEVRHMNWRRWLVLFNSLQVLPGIQMATFGGIAGGDCDALVPFSGINVAAAVSADQVAWSQDWIEAMKDALQPLQTGMKVLAQMGLPAPMVGHELADQRGNVVADAELAWPEALLVVLRADQGDMERLWFEAGWRVMILDASGEKMVDGTEWVAAVGQTMNKTTTNQKAS